MALNDSYLPEASNAELPQYLRDVLAGAQGAPVPTPGAAPMPVPQPALDPFLAALLPTEAAIEIDPESGLLMPSVKRGAAQTFASLANLVGAEETAAEAMQYAAQFPRQIQDIQDVQSLADLGTYAVESAAENVANILAIGAGALVGSVAGAPMVVGGGLVNFALQAGESKMSVEQAGGDPNLVNVGIPAALNTAIDTFSIAKIAKKAGVLKEVVEHLDEAAEISGLGARIKRGVRTGTEAFALEGSTEVIQNYNNLVAAKLSTDKTIREALTLQGEDVDDLINAFAAGGLGAATTAGPLATVFTGKKVSESADQGSNAAPVQPTEADPNPLTGEPTQAQPTPAPPEGTPDIDDTDFTQEFGDANEDPVELDPDNEVEQLKAEIERRRVYLEAGQTEAPFRAQARRDPAYLSRKDQLSTGDDPTFRQPMPSRFWEDKTYTALGEESTVFSSIVADTPEVTTTANYRKRFTETEQYAIADYIEILRTSFMPDAPIIIGHQGDFSGSRSSSTMASMSPVEIEGRNAYIMEVNPAGMARIAQAVGVERNTLLYETVAHEFGHALSAEQFKRENNQTQSAIYGEYQQWVDTTSKKTMREFILDRFPPVSGKYYLDNIPQELLEVPFMEAAREIGWTGSKLRYHLSFEEYAADNMAKFVARDAKLANQVSKETKGYWTKAIDTFLKIFRTISKFLPQPKFKAWVEKVRMDKALELLLDVPLASQQIVDDLGEFIDLDINKLRDNLNYKMSDGVRMNETAGTILQDAQQLEALRRNYRVSTGFTRKVAGRFLTPAQIAERYNIPQAKAYMERVYDYYQTKMRGISKADSIAKTWMDLPEAQSDAFGKFLYAISEKSDELQRRLTPEEMAVFREEFGITDETATLYGEMDTSFQEILSRLETSILKDIARSYTNNPGRFVEEYQAAQTMGDKTLVITSYGVEDYAGFLNELQKAEKSFDALRNKNYFPRMRFGDFTITVKRKYLKGEKARETTAEFLTFESKKERDKMLEQYLKDYSDDIQNGTVDVIGSKLDDTTRSLYGMPQLVVDRIANSLRSAEGTGLTADQERAIADIALDLSPGKRYLRHMQHRKNTAGFSTEAMRTYAAYMSNASNHLARVEHTADMAASLRDLRQAQKGMAGDVTDLAELDSYYTDHFKYLLNPENDWTKLRAFGFLWYLGANPKSALVNTTQLPMVTYPFLASRYGDTRTVSSLAKALKDVTAHFTLKKKYSEEEQRLLDRGVQEGWIDESMASDLAGISEGTALQRILPTNKAHKVMNNINYYGGFLFSIAEKYNRQVTALAAFRLHMKDTGDFEASHRAAKDAVHKSQFEYAKYNRPEFMRGKKSAFFLFYNYTQQFMYMAFAGGGKREDKQTAIRMWGMLLLLAGVQGLPMAEYVLSTLDLFGTQAKRFFGMQNPEVNVRRDLRELFDDLGMNPDLMMHGTGRYLGAGPLKLLELFGAPVPNLDITGSLSMGEPLPGFRVNDLKGDPSEMAGQLLLNGLGPIPNIALGMWDAVSSTDPDKWKNFEKALPIALKNVSKASRYATREMETSRGGAEFLPYDGNNPYEMGEIIGQAMGFTSTRLAQKREMYGEQIQSSMYWSARRSLLLERYAYATKTRDKEARVQALQAIRDFNKSLTEPALKPYKISGPSMARSLKVKMRVLQRRERGIPTADRDRLIYSDIEKLYMGEE